jgi:hypothetical protein
MIEIATELKASVANIMEHAQVLVELDTSGSTSQSRERSASQFREESTNESRKASTEEFREGSSANKTREESTNDSHEEFTQEFRETPTSESRERSSSISFLFTSKDKLKVKAKNVRLTSRELAQTLRKYSFLSDKRTGERKRVRGTYGTPISNGISRGLRDRTNSPVSFQKKIGHEFSQQTPPRSPREGFTVFRSKESPL